MKLKNVEMSNYLTALNNIADKVDGLLAYAVARNIRKIYAEVTEYENLKNDLIVKYGVLGDDGVSRIQVDSEECKKFLKEIEKYTNIEHEVDIYMLNIDELKSSSLNAKEILSIDFMLSE